MRSQVFRSRIRGALPWALSALIVALINVFAFWGLRSQGATVLEAILGLSAFGSSMAAIAAVAQGIRAARDQKRFAEHANRVEIRSVLP